MAKDKKLPSNEQLSLLAGDEVASRIHSSNEIRRRFSALEACLEKPALLTSESDEDFEALFNQLLLSVIPSDAIEYIYIRDAAILTFDINRLQQSKIALVKAAQPHAVCKLVAPALASVRAETISVEWTSGDPSAISQVNEVLKMRGLKKEAIQLKAIELRLDEIQKIENMIATLESRRFAFFREIDRRRDGFKKQLQEAVRNTDGSYSLMNADDETKAEIKSSERLSSARTGSKSVQERGAISATPRKTLS